MAILPKYISPLSARKEPVRNARRKLVGWAAIVLAVTLASSTLTQPATPDELAAMNQQRALASYQALQANAYDSSLQLYRLGPAASTSLWPFTNATAGTDYLAATAAGSAYLPDVAARLQGLLKYQDVREYTPAGVAQPPAFESSIPLPFVPGGTTYYDDNAWVSLNLLDQYRLTLNAQDLQLAQETFAFVQTGWSTGGPCPGGIYWADASWSHSRNTVSNAPNAEVSLQLYQITRNPSYLTWGLRLYNWVNRCLEAPNGMYYDHITAAGTIDHTLWSYNQGTMVSAGALAYQITGDTTYLDRATRTAEAAVNYYGTGNVLIAEGPAFNAIYFRGLFLLNKLRPNAAYENEAASYGATMWARRNPVSGLFPGADHVNSTAPMVEVYALLAGCSLPAG